MRMTETTRRNGAFFMMVMSDIRRVGLLLALAVSIGCSRSSAPEEIGDRTKLQSLANAYAAFVKDAKRAPNGWADLAPRFKKDIVADPEKFFVSSRDGQPYVIIWGVDAVDSTRAAQSVLVYESQGADGKRLVADCARRVKELKDAEFRRMRFAKGHKPEG